MGVEDVDALARARDDECAKTAAASPHARRQNAFNRPARQGRTAIIDDHARADDKALRRVVGTVALLNLAYFGVEFADRQSVVNGESVSVRVDPGRRRNIKKTERPNKYTKG